MLILSVLFRPIQFSLNVLSAGLPVVVQTHTFCAESLHPLHARLIFLLYLSHSLGPGRFLRLGELGDHSREVGNQVGA